MVISLKLKSLLTVVLLSGFSGFSAADAGKNVGGNNNLAPEVTADEASLSFGKLPLLKEAFIDTTPADRKDGFSIGELGVDGGDKAMVLQLAQELADNNQGDYDSLLIAHKGKFLFESYYKRGRINLPHFQSSASKGYTALVLGRAIQLGYLTMADLNKPLVSFLKGLDSTKFVKGVENITLHQAMTMRSGLRFSDKDMTQFRENPEQYKGLVQVQAFLELSEPVTSESQSYNYRGYDPIMVMHVLDAVVPGSAKSFIKNEFFDKLGINNYSWRNDLSDLPIGDNGVSLTSRDMLKLGTLVINGGKWNDEQFLSANYLAKATSAITRATEDWQGPETYFYGYLWYQTNLTAGDKSYDVKIAWGGGGNRIILIDELDLVVAISGHDMVDETIMTLISKNILPAFFK
jgi:CubicO group peptidase (beta-lactamase class C family)